jgi:hypothetical protein
MDEKEIVWKLYSYAFYAAALCFAVISILSGNYAVAIVSCALLLVSAVYLNSGHMINNLLINRSNVIAYYNDYKLNVNLVSLTKRDGGSYKSLSAAVLQQESAPDVQREAMRSLIESIAEPFEFSIMVMQADKKRLVDALDMKRRMKEIQLGRIKPGKYDAINALKREIQLIEAEEDSIRKSGRAFNTMVRITAMALAGSESEAARQSVRSLERICDSFSATTKLEYEILKGEARVESMRMSM